MVNRENLQSLHAEIPGLNLEVLKTLVEKFPIEKWTPVQRETIPHFVNHKDVVVQAATGSGKTLAYLLPVVHIMLKEQATWNKWQIGGIILVPSRELAYQVSEWAEKVRGDLVVQCFTGGTKTETDCEKFVEEGCNILIATPGRLEDLLTGPCSSRFSGHVRQLQVLVFDEADRLLEMGFAKSISSILSHLPKQRRTGLFSATQSRFVDDLVKTGLRNPITITVSSQKTVMMEGLDGGKEGKVDGMMDESIPEGLNNFYAIVPPAGKFACLFKFLRKHSNEKILLFFSTCACVEYFSEFLKSKLKVPVVALHGKQRKKRKNLFDDFRKMNSGVAVSTDVMARGIDMPDIDWVIQYDPPKTTAFYVHRSGRCARGGRQGNSLILLHPSEESYIDLIQKNQGVTIDRLKLAASKKYTETLRSKFVKRACRNREFLEMGSSAFVSYIQAYCKHDCNIVCSIDNLDVARVANSSGRCARGGRQGNSLILLHPSEESYIDLIQKNQGVTIDRLKLGASKKYTETLRSKFVKRACRNREFLEMGSSAFVSYIQAYCKHDCNIVCSIDNLDVARVANSSGRCARGGRQGNSLILLHPSEESYIDLIQKNQGVTIDRLPLGASKKYTETLRSKFVKRACRNREFLEMGSSAFVSYIQAYCKHDCNIVCSIDNLDVARVANSYGLLRLPRMKEMSYKDLRPFLRTDIDTSTIEYADKKREEKRVEKRKLGKEREEKGVDYWVKEEEKRKTYFGNDLDTSRRKRLKKQDVDDINDDIKLMRRLKKGRLSKGEFEAEFMK